MSRWLTYDEVAEYLRVSRATVFNWVKAGEIPAPKLLGKRSRRFDREAIDAALVGSAKSDKGEPRLGDIKW